MFTKGPFSVNNDMPSGDKFPEGGVHKNNKNNYF